MQENYAISIKKENQSIYIFSKDNTTLDCNTIHNAIFESIKNNETYKDINMQDMYDYIIHIFLDSVLLLGSTESTNNPLFFGELDSSGNLIESTPIYHLQGNEDLSNIDSKVSNNSNIDSSASLQNDKNIGTSTLQIFLNNSTLTILNYSLLESSLNIKLECTSKESKEILDKEKQAKETIESKEILEREKITIKKILRLQLRMTILQALHYFTHTRRQ